MGVKIQLLLSHYDLCGFTWEICMFHPDVPGTPLSDAEGGTKTSVYDSVGFTMGSLY